MNKERLKLVILVSHPIQYFVPVFRSLGTRKDIDLVVLYRSRIGVDVYQDAGFSRAVCWDIPLLDGYQSFCLSKKRQLRGIEFSVIWNIWKQKPDVLLLHGYNQGTNLLALVVGKAIGCKVLMRGDTRLSNNPRSQPLRGWFKRWLFGFIDGFVCVGSSNRVYYQACGVPKNKLYFAPFCVSNEFFSIKEPERHLLRKDLRKRLEVSSDDIVVLFAAKLISRKGAMDLISAFRIACASNSHALLIIAGSGPEESTLREAIENWSDCRVRFVGFQNQSKLPSLYASSDIFVLPATREPWGLAVNEAMAAGLPIIVSDDVGSAVDLVANKDTGLVYPVGNISALAEALGKLIASEDLRKKFGANASKLISNWDVPVCAEEIAKAAKLIVSIGV